MTLTEGLLFAIIMILTFYVFTKSTATTSVAAAPAIAESFKLNPNPPITMQKVSPEHKAIAENNEYFTGSNIANMTAELHGEDGAIVQHSEHFLNPNTSFRDYIMGQAVDASVTKNHQEFVKDRLGSENTQNITGRTYMLPDWESTPAVPTIGLRLRSQNVNVDDNVSQVADVDSRNYSDKPTFSWNSL